MLQKIFRSSLLVLALFFSFAKWGALSGGSSYIGFTLGSGSRWCWPSFGGSVVAGGVAGGMISAFKSAEISVIVGGGIGSAIGSVPSSGSSRQ